MVSLTFLARAELMTKLALVLVEEAEAVFFQGGEPHWVPLTLRWRQRAMFRLKGLVTL